MNSIDYDFLRMLAPSNEFIRLDKPTTLTDCDNRELFEKSCRKIVNIAIRDHYGYVSKETLAMWFEMYFDCKIVKEYGIFYTHNLFNQRFDIDQPIEARIQGLGDIAKSFIQPDVLTHAAVGTIPYFGPSLVASKIACNITNQSTKTFSKIDTILESIQSLLAPLTKISEASSWLTEIRRLLMSLINVHFAATENKIHSLILNLTNFAVDCGLSSHIFGKFFDLMRQTTMDSLKGAIQGPMEDISDLIHDYSSQAQIVASGILVILYAIFYKLTNSTPEVGKSIQFLSNLGKTLGGIRTLKSVLIDASEMTLHWFKDNCLGLEDPSRLKEVIANISVWFDEVQALLVRVDTQNATDKLLEDPEFLLYIETLYKKGLEFSIEISNKRLSEKVRFPFEQHFRLLTELFKKCETSGAFGNKPRVAPIVIWLYGASGVGKSGVSWPLAIDLNNQILTSAPKEERKNFVKHIYFRNVEQEFWDGYQGQNIVVYDDFGQMKDAQGQPNAEFFEIIRTANISPYPLHMAHLEEKRKAKFTSKVAILSSNQDKMNINSLTHPDAVDRRIDIKAEVCVLPEFAKAVNSRAQGRLVTRLDTAKVLAEFGEEVVLATQVYAFKLVNTDTGAYTGEVLNYTEFKERCQQILRQRINQSHGLNKYLESYAVGEHPDKDIPCRKIEAAIQGIEEEKFYDCDVAADLVPISTDEAMRLLNQKKEVLTKDGVHVYDAYPAIFPIWKVQCYKRISQLQVYLSQLKDMFKDAVSNVVQTLTDFYNNHPMLTTLTLLGGIITGFTLLGGWEWIFPTKTTARTRKLNIENSNKKGVSVDSNVAGRHTHVCVKCNTHYTHFHSFTHANHKQFQDQCPNPECVWYHKGSNPTLSHITHYLDTIEGNVSGDLTTAKNRTIKVEGNVSGDSVTAKQRTVKIEGNVSGDSITNKPKITKIEGNVSGDNITRNRKAIKIEGNVSGDAVTRSKTRIQVEGSEQMQEETLMEIHAEMQMWKDQTAQTLITNRILNNLYRILGQNEHGQTELMNCLFVRGRIALIPLHLVGYLKYYDMLVLSNAYGVKYEIPIDSLRFIQIYNSIGKTKEACLMYVDSSYIQLHPDLIKHFQTSIEMGKWKAADVAIPCMRYFAPLKRFLPTILGNTECKALDTQMTIIDDEKNASLILREGVEYFVNTKAGDCGSPVVVNETSVLRKICGIHVAGQPNGRAFAESITQRDLLEALSTVTADHQICLDLDMFKGKFFSIDYSTPQAIYDATMKMVPASKFNAGAICRDPVIAPTKTDLRPSKISGSVVEPTTKPGYLRPVVLDGILTDIKKKNLAKAAMDTPFIYSEEVEQATLPVKMKLLQNIRPELRRVLTFEEGIIGNREISDFMEPMNRSSSPGYPWINKRQKGMMGKRQWLGDDEYVFDEEVRQKCMERVELAKKGMRVPTVWIDTLKDERRPIEKANSGKTRVFANGPMDYTIVFRQYFLGFMAHVMENRILNEQSIGTNTWAQDWGKTARYLTRKGKKVIAGDFSTFDGTLNACITNKLVDVVNEFYDDGEENALIRKVLFAEVVNSIHLYNDIFYQWTHSQPSGCPITTVINSFYNSVSMRIVYNRLARANGFPRFYNKFDDYCTMVSYGDDNVINISDIIVSWFNQQEITKGYATIGMIYTDESKSGTETLYRDISEVKYLKRNFRFDTDCGVWKAPLDLDVILEMTNWIRGDLDQAASTLENCSNAIQELSQHPEDIFNKYVPLINKACLKECKELPKQNTYKGYWENQYLEYYQKY